MSESTTRVVLVLFDGLRPDMVTPELMPNLTRFASGGTWFREARSVFPSMTRVATTSIATGAPPVVHGVVGNAFYFPQVTTAHLIDTSLGADVALAEQATSGRFVTAETFGDRLAAAGKRLAVVHTGSAGSAHVINPRAGANGHWTFSIFGAEHTQTPEAVIETVGRFGPLPLRSLPRFEEIDYATTVLVDHVLHTIDPDVALIWFNEPDTSYHYKFLGAPETQAVLRHVDAAFGRIVEAIAARPDADRFLVMATSDHGQISSDGLVDMVELLSAEGHTAYKAAERRLDGAKITITGGNMGEIRILDGDARRRQAIADWLMDQPFIGGLFSPARNDVEGEVEGSLSLALVSLDHERQPYLVFMLHSSDTHDRYGFPGLGLITGGVPVGGGMHGGLNRYELNTTLIVTGNGFAPGIVSSAPAGIIDIAPTILGALGIPPAATMCGRDLANLHGDAPGQSLMLETEKGSFRQRLVLNDASARRIIAFGGRVS